MNEQEQLKKWIPLLLLLHAMVCLIYAVLNYDIRVLYFETSNHFMGMLNSASPFNIQNRFAKYVFEIFPVLLVKQGVGLKWVMIVYSASYFVIEFGWVLFTFYVLRNPAMALGIGMVWVLGMGPNFFMADSEITQGAVLFLVFGATMEHFLQAENNVQQKRRFALVIALIALLVFTHPFYVVAIAFYFLVLFKQQKISTKLLKKFTWGGGQYYYLSPFSLPVTSTEPFLI